MARGSGASKGGGRGRSPTTRGFGTGRGRSVLTPAAKVKPRTRSRTPHDPPKRITGKSEDKRRSAAPGASPTTPPGDALRTSAARGRRLGGADADRIANTALATGSASHPGADLQTFSSPGSAYDIPWVSHVPLVGLEKGALVEVQFETETSYGTSLGRILERPSCFESGVYVVAEFLGCSLPDCTSTCWGK